MTAFDRPEARPYTATTLRETLMRTRALAASAALLCLAAAAAAQPSRVMLAGAECVPRGEHGLVRGGGGPVPDGGEVRVYFRRQGHGDFYYVPTRLAGDGTFSARLPVPEPDNTAAELYAAIYDAARRPVAQSRVQVAPVREDCPEVERRDDRGDDGADRLVVGETTLSQKLRKVAWWQCDNLRERIDVYGERRDDESCLPVAWWQRPAVLVPLTLIGGGGIVTVVDPEPPPEPSPVAP